MSLIYEYKGLDGTYVDISAHVDDENLEVTENSEEGSVAISTIVVDDPDVSIEIPAHRAFRIRETDVEEGDEPYIFRGYTGERTYEPMDDVSAQGRRIRLQVADVNTVLYRRVMIGADSKRKAETDVHRWRWLLTTAEAGLIDDDTYLSAAAPKDMDAADYRVQMMDSVGNDAAQASGKNWGMTYDSTPGHGYQLWYGADELATYDSGCLLTNDPGLEGDPGTFIISDDTKIRLNPERVFSGSALRWKKGTVYRQRAATAHDFARRDVIMQAPHVGTKAKAIARDLRYLESFKEEDLTVDTTTIYVDAADVSKIRPFMRVRFQSSMSLETAEPIWCRVMKRTVAFWKPGRFKVTLKLAGGASAPATLSCSTALSARLVEIESDHSNFSMGIIEHTITTTVESVVLAAVIVANPNIPTATDITAEDGATLISQDQVSASGGSGGLIYKAGITGATTMGAGYTPGYGSPPGTGDTWGMVSIAIPTSATGPVQENSDVSTSGTSDRFVTLDAPPTPGNMLIMCAQIRGSGTDDGIDISTFIRYTDWTLLGIATTHRPFTGGAMHVWARCVSEGDGDTYDIGNNGSEAWLSVSEWAVT